MDITKVKIFNLALNNLGVSIQINNANQDDDPRAQMLSNYYEIARDSVLEAHEWSFASVRTTLANMQKSCDPNFRFACKLPSDCIAARAIIEPYSKKEKKFENAINENGEKIILTNYSPCILRYTKRIENEAMFSASFINCLAFYLAYLAAQVIVGSANKKNTNFQDYQISIRQAMLNDVRKDVNHDQDDLIYTDMR
ncbi:hypothetical protein IJ531_01445 [bacterium]|nr:hypothetical protein [bacterium]